MKPQNNSQTKPSETTVSIPKEVEINASGVFFDGKPFPWPVLEFDYAKTPDKAEIVKLSIPVQEIRISFAGNELRPHFTAHES